MPYEINNDPLVGVLEKLDVQRVIDETTESWVNHTLCRVDDVVVRLGMLHRPVVPQRTSVLMIEKAGVVATGD